LRTGCQREYLGPRDRMYQDARENCIMRNLKNVYSSSIIRGKNQERLDGQGICYAVEI
jgi:hypothetical protein